MLVQKSVGRCTHQGHRAGGMAAAVCRHAWPRAAWLLLPLSLEASVSTHLSAGEVGQRGFGQADELGRVVAVLLEQR